MSKTERKLHAWKEKAKERRVLIWALKKRIKELVASRDRAKGKLKESQGELKRLRAELKALGAHSSTNVRHHSYSAEETGFFVHLKTLGGCSFRACIRVLLVMRLLYGLEVRVPSPSSIRNWEAKMGLHKIRRRCPSPEGGVGALIMDESVSIGSQKVLLLAGVDLGRYGFGSALTMEEAEALSIRVGKSWKALDIAPVIGSATERGYRFAYCCSDNGNNLRKTLKMKDMVHIEGCGHCMGKALEKLYGKDEGCRAFCAEKALFKKQNLLSRHAAPLPPKHRTKGRFMNLWPTCEWAVKVLAKARPLERSGGEPEAFEKIRWVLGHAGLIEKLHREQALINGVNKVLKNKRLSAATAGECREKLKREEGRSPELCAAIEGYPGQNLKKLPGGGLILCSSDIIESIFGKLKYNIGESPSAGLTEGSLAVATYGKKYSVEEIREGMEGVKIVDIQKWREENLPVSMLQKRRELFKNTG